MLKPYENKLTLISSQRFTYTNGKLVAEASDLGRGWLERLYEDAEDLGIAVQSARTGAVVRFYLDGVVRDAENDVMAWELKPLNRPNLDVTVVVFND